MPWRQLIAGCIVSTRCSCVCPYDATRPVDGTQLAASGGLGPVPRKLFCDIGPHARRRVAWPCPRFPLHRAHSACMACSYACPYDATRRVDNAQLAASGGLGPVPQMLMHAAGRTYPVESSWGSSSARFSCIVSACCSCVCPYDDTRHVDGTQLAASGGLGPHSWLLAVAWGPSCFAWRDSSARFSCVVSTCCSCVCPYDATRHVDGTQLAASGA
jgi:hypothetical protein